MATNDIDFVRRVVAFWSANGVTTRIFGGWAEELLGESAPWEHGDLDLMCCAEDFAHLDEVAQRLELEEIVGKRFVHKRAFLIEGVMVELFLVRRDEHGPYTVFWADLRHDWPHDDDCVIDGLPVSPTANFASYRAAHELLKFTG